MGITISPDSNDFLGDVYGISENQRVIDMTPLSEMPVEFFSRESPFVALLRHGTGSPTPRWVLRDARRRKKACVEWEATKRELLRLCGGIHAFADPRATRALLDRIDPWDDPVRR